MGGVIASSCRAQACPGTDGARRGYYHCADADRDSMGTDGWPGSPLALHPALAACCGRLIWNGPARVAAGRALWHFSCPGARLAAPKRARSGAARARSASAGSQAEAGIRLSISCVQERDCRLHESGNARRVRPGPSQLVRPRPAALPILSWNSRRIETPRDKERLRVI
jgi:hypothetical protein